MCTVVRYCDISSKADRGDNLIGGYLTYVHISFIHVLSATLRSLEVVTLGASKSIQSTLFYS